MGARRGGQGESRIATILVLTGVAGVLTATFVAGLWTGRHWPVLTGTAGPASMAAPAASRRGAPERPTSSEPLPALTFYHELTAPLTAPPPPPRPSRASRPADRADEGAAPAASPPPSPPAGPSPAPTGARFTVQVGSYQARAPAETLRTALAAAGHDARIVEADTPGGVRYRVQVGAFPTREAAREAAARLAAERSLSTLVTPR